jgi:anti-anti-sigma factor
MSTVSIGGRVRPAPDAGAGNLACFATWRLHTSLAVVSVYGEVDASNADEFVHFVTCHAERAPRLILDLKGVSFFGTSGFSALRVINVGCALQRTDWVVVPSEAVSRLIRLGDRDHALPTADNVEAAAAVLRRTRSQGPLSRAD